MAHRVRERGSYDIYIEYDDVKVGYRLADGEAGLSWHHGLQPLLPAEQRTAGAFEYQQIPAESDVPLGFDNWTSGCGIFEVSNPQANGTYNYSQNIDASYGDRLYLSPAFNEVFKTKPATTIEAAPTYLSETSIGLFLCAGRYIYKYGTADGVFDEVVDLGAGQAASGPIVEFSGRIYLPAGDALAYRFSTDGASWTTSTASDPYAKFFAARGRATTSPQFWKVNDNGNLKVSASPEASGATWSTATPTGHTSETVNGLVTASDKLWVTKEEGIFSYDGTTVQDFWTGGRQMRRTSNGKNPLQWVDGLIYVPYGDRIMQVDPVNETFTLVYPTDYMLGHDELNGSLTAIAGDADWIYIAQKNNAGDTYIIKLNPYKTVHTWVYQSSNDCNCLLVVGTGSINSTNPAVIAGHENTIGYYTNPPSGLRPEDDDNYLFTSSTGVITGPYVNVGAKLFKKFLNAGRILGQNLTGGKTSTLRYEIDYGTPVSIVTASSNGETSASVTSEVEFNQIRYNMQMVSGVPTRTPITRSIVLNTILNPPRKKAWRLAVEVGSGVVLSSGSRASLAGNYLESFLFAGAQKRVTLYDRRAQRTFIGRIIDIQGRMTQALAAGDFEIFDILFYEISETSSGDTAVYNSSAYNTGKVYGS